MDNCGSPISVPRFLHRTSLAMLTGKKQTRKTVPAFDISPRQARISETCINAQMLSTKTIKVSAPRFPFFLSLFSVKHVTITGHRDAFWLTCGS